MFCQNAGTVGSNHPAYLGLASTGRAEPLEIGPETTTGGEGGRLGTSKNAVEAFEANLSGRCEGSKLAVYLELVPAEKDDFRKSSRGAHYFLCIVLRWMDVRTLSYACA